MPECKADLRFAIRPRSRRRRREEPFMRKWTKTAGLLFVAASAVLPNGATLAQAATAPTPAPRPRRTTRSRRPRPASPPRRTGQSVSDAQVNVTDAGTVEIHVNDANLVEVLRMLSLQMPEEHHRRRKEVRGTVTANLYDVTVREALDAILHANGYAYREKGNFIYVYTPRKSQEIEKAEPQVTKTEVFRLYYTPAANAVEHDQAGAQRRRRRSSFTTPATSGIASDGDRRRRQRARDRGHPRRHRLPRATSTRSARSSRRSTAARSRSCVEATILRATLNDDNALGVDFNVARRRRLRRPIGTSNGQITNASLARRRRPITEPRRTASAPATPSAAPINGGLKVGVVTQQRLGLRHRPRRQSPTRPSWPTPRSWRSTSRRAKCIVGSEDGYRTTVTTETHDRQTRRSSSRPVRG